MRCTRWRFCMEVLPITFNFDLFSRITASVYRQMESPFSLEEVLDIFYYFFSAYEEATGEAHPGIRRDQIRQLIEIMPYSSRDGAGFDSKVIDFSPVDYPNMIDGYFATEFAYCNYRINHFFSGQIRELRYYEECY